MELDIVANLDRNHFLVLNELRKTPPSETSPDEAGLEIHAERVIRALDSLLASAVADIDVDDMQFAPEEETLLEIVLALHDIGKQEYFDGSHAEAGYRLLNRHHVALREAIKRYCEEHNIVPVPIEDDHVRMILWLVRHHEALQEIYRAERRATYLDQIGAQLCKHCNDCTKQRPCFNCKRKINKALRLLMTISLCDSLSDHAQQDVRPKVDFWRKVIKQEHRARLSDLSHRVARWTRGGTNGHVEGSFEHKAAADQLWHQLKPATRDVFDYRVGHVVHGSELLRALDLRWKARLLNVIADHYAHNFDAEEITLSFARPYHPDEADAAELLAQYEEALRNGTITTTVNYEKKEIRVACPTGKR